MIDKRTATAWLRRTWQEQIDGPVREAGRFVRAANSLIHKRSVPDGHQKIQVDLIVHPRYAKDAIQVVLGATIQFPEMAKIASMFGANAGEHKRRGAVHGATLDSIARNPPMFLFRSEEELARITPDLRRSIIEKIIPYLDERDTIDKLTSRMWQSWSGNKWRGDEAGRWPVMVAAGEAARDDWKSAAETLEIAYPIGSGERDRYAEAFRLVAQHQHGRS